jgi:Thermopsin
MPPRRSIPLPTVALVAWTLLLVGSVAPFLGGPPPAAASAPLASVHPSVNRLMVPIAAAPTATAAYVDPFAFLSSEPAPMGIADFGVTGVGGAVHPYSYDTPIVQGTVQIDSLDESGDGAHDMTFQLNTVLVLEDGATNYSYWIQNIAGIDTSSNFIYWVDNIWNLSGTTQSDNPLAPGELRGNGTVADDYGLEWYADSNTYDTSAGAGIELTYPATLTIRSVASTIDGYPQVGFLWDDGYGWHTFDNVTFEHASHWKSVGFVVDGYRYTPLGVFYDAEWDYSGSHQGQHNIDCNLSMSLQYWNGHNLEATPSAWNFGSDTAESVDNVIAAPGVTPGGGLVSDLTTGAGRLGLLYNASNVAVVNLSIPTLANGTVVANGAQYPYRGGSANLTLAPGRYEFQLFNGSELLSTGNVSLAPGSYQVLTLPFPVRPITFHETGLAPGTPWSVTVLGTIGSSDTAWINVSEQDGSYNYSVASVAGYLDHARTGGVNVSGGPASVGVVFWTFNYTVSFVQYGLPATQTWWVVFGGATVPVRGGAAATFPSPNGTFNYSVVSTNQYLGAPAEGQVVVNGSPTEVATTFSIHLGWIAGTVTPATASITIAGASVPVTDGAFNLSVVPGTYEVESTASGYETQSINVTVTPGNATPAIVALAALPSVGAPPAPSSGTSAETAEYLGGAVAVIVVVAALTALVMRRRRR